MPERSDEGPWATANRCAILGTGYLELIGVVDNTAFNPWEKFLSRFEGLHLLALRVGNADAAYGELQNRTSTLNAPVQRERKLDVEGCERTMRFRNIFSRDEAYPEGRYIILEHQTPDFLWQPRYQVHPNGAQSLSRVMVCADDVASQSARLAALIGRPAVGLPGGPFHFDLSGGGRIELYDPPGFESRFGWQPANLPCFAGVDVRFASRAHAAKLMEDNGVPVNRREAEWFISPGFTNGFILRLSE